MFKLFIPMKPIPKGRPRFSRRGRAYTPKRTATFERDFLKFVKKHNPPLCTKPTIVFLQFRFNPPKKPQYRHPANKIGDLDNFVKACCDALNEICWSDDSLICKIVAEKIYTEGAEGIVLTYHHIGRLQEWYNLLTNIFVTKE